jgi:hypothetical protein
MSRVIRYLPGAVTAVGGQGGKAHVEHATAGVGATGWQRAKRSGTLSRAGSAPRSSWRSTARFRLEAPANREAEGMADVEGPGARGWGVSWGVWT